MLKFHNERGGRVGGASRWEDHLDDMPTLGWGYGAITSNRTADFQALLYGQAAVPEFSRRGCTAPCSSRLVRRHMSTYQSRGTFHSTEQLSFLGEGRYRKFLHWDDPSPDERGASSRPNAATGRPARAARAGYYSPEQDISFCIVSQVLTARLVRWMLVFDDVYRGAAPRGPTGDARVWLARAVPKRWFAAGGFNVSKAPCLAGDVSYQLTPAARDEPTGATGSRFAFNVQVHAPTAAASAVQSALYAIADVTWSLRWPGALVGGDPACTGCTIAAVDAASGYVSVRIAGGSSAEFTVAASVAL